MKNKNKLPVAENSFQQGDVIGIRIKQLPDGERKQVVEQKLVVAHGESGHSHVIEDEKSSMMLIGDKLYLKLEQDAILKHEEHGAQVITKGIWEVGRVQEYDYFQQMQRQVQD